MLPVVTLCGAGMLRQTAGIRRYSTATAMKRDPLWQSLKLANTYLVDIPMFLGKVRVWNGDVIVAVVIKIANFSPKLKKCTGLQRDSNPWPLRQRCSTLSTELWRPFPPPPFPPLHMLGADLFIELIFTGDRNETWRARPEKFFRAKICNCLNCFYNWDDHISI